MYLVTVIFEVDPAHADAFGIRMAQQAADSLSREPGCSRFDVWTAPGNASRVFLYEIYDDAAAFAAHLESAHFRDFDAAVAPWVQTKTVEQHAITPVA